MIPLFKMLEIETHSYCSRKCSMCMRNNEPERTRFDKKDNPIFKKMPSKVFYKVIDECIDAGLGPKYPPYMSSVCLSHYNEPLFDDRIVEFVKYVKDKNLTVFLCTNGDKLTPELAKQLDGILDHIAIGLYDDDSKITYWQSLFSKTRVTFSKCNFITHWSPEKERLNNMIEQHKNLPCLACRKRFVVKYDGEMLMCCNDLSGHFNLGNVKKKSIEQLWFSEKHTKILEDLAKFGGRKKYPHCSICPRPGVMTP